jgi:hypothetical protein
VLKSCPFFEPGGELELDQSMGGLTKPEQSSIMIEKMPVYFKLDVRGGETTSPEPPGQPSRIGQRKRTVTAMQPEIHVLVPRLGRAPRPGPQPRASITLLSAAGKKENIP